MNVVSGVVDAHLADDIFLEYNRIINPNTFLIAGVSVSFPGKASGRSSMEKLPAG